MRYLVTGGVGFLGANLCKRLLDQGSEVVVLDDLSTGYERNLEILSKRDGFKFVKHDIVNPLPDLGDFDFIYNLACPASPPRYQKDPIQTFRTSVSGVWNVLMYAKSAKTPVFQASTSEIYGDPLEHPQSESYWGNVNPIGLRSCYDEGKRAAESLMFDFMRKYNHPIKIARIFNTYGPLMDPEDGRVISNFITQAISKKPLTIYGDGKQTRSFCYVDDLIDGFISLEKSDGSITGPINLGNDNEFTLMELIENLEENMGENLEKKHLDLPSDDPIKRNPDIAMSKKLLGWEPKTELNSGLRKTIEYFREITD
jgi:UDP-glucuronate decarboxylase